MYLIKRPVTAVKSKYSVVLTCWVTLFSAILRLKKTNRHYIYLLHQCLYDLLTFVSESRPKKKSMDREFFFLYTGEALKSPCLSRHRWCLPPLMTRSLARKQLSSAKNKLLTGPLRGRRSKDECSSLHQP